MFQKIVNSPLVDLAFVAFGLLITSCSDDGFSINDAAEDFVTTENFVNQSVSDLQSAGSIGRTGCYEFVFPLGLMYPDGTDESVDSYEALRSTLTAWFEENAETIGLDVDSTGDFNIRDIRDIDDELLPSLAFPLDVVSEDGEMITVNDQSELFALRRACKQAFNEDRRNNNRDGGRDKCFSLVFPVTVALPDGETFDADDRRDLKSQLREWKAANPDAEEQPMLQFPITVQLEDESTVERADSDEFRAPLDSCTSDE